MNGISRKGPNGPVSEFAPRGKTTLPDVVPPTPLQHEIEAEEAARAAQRYHKQLHEIQRLTAERDEWRRHAELADAEIMRLEAREQYLVEKLEATHAELERAEDEHQIKMVRLISQFESAASILTHSMKVIKGEAVAIGMKLTHAIDDPPPPANDAQSQTDSNDAEVPAEAHA